MNSALLRLAERKKLLLARSALQRFEITERAGALREGMRWPRAGMTLMASPPIRSALLGVVMGAAGRGTLSRLVRMAAIAYVAVRVAGVVLRSAAASREAGEGG